MTSHNLTLYHYWRSSSSWRVRWALDYKNIAYQKVAVNLLNGDQNSTDFSQKNPAQTVPCLVIDGVHAAESQALLEWIEEAYPDHPLLPNNAMSRLMVRQLMQTIVCSTQPLQNLEVLNYVEHMGLDKLQWAIKYVRKGLQTFENRLLMMQSAGSFCCGGQLTFADLCLIPQCYNAQRFGIDLQEFPTIATIHNHCQSLSSYQSSKPEAQV